MIGLPDRLAALVGLGDRAPEAPAERVRFRLERMRPKARERAMALRRQAIEDLGSVDHADEWLASPVPFLGNRRPIDIMHSARGAAAVEQTLFNMRHGIYS